MLSNSSLGAISLSPLYKVSLSFDSSLFISDISGFIVVIDSLSLFFFIFWNTNINIEITKFNVINNKAILNALGDNSNPIREILISPTIAIVPNVDCITIAEANPDLDSNFGALISGIENIINAYINIIKITIVLGESSKKVWLKKRIYVINKSNTIDNNILMILNIITGIPIALIFIIEYIRTYVINNDTYINKSQFNIKNKVSYENDQ